MKLLEIIRAAIARLAELTKDELDELRTNIVKCAKDFDSDSDENLAVLSELADAADLVSERSVALEAQQAEQAEQAKSARDRIAALNGDDKGDENDGTATDEVAEGTEVEGAETPEAIAASGKNAPIKSSPSRMARLSNVTPSPEHNASIPRPSLVAAGQLVDHKFGDEFEDRGALAKEMAMILDGLDRNGRPGTGRVLIARARWGNLYPEERRLSGDSTSEDYRKIDAVARSVSSRRALVASGGVPLPTNVDYSMDVWATADRPIRDGLPSFNVDRGGLVYRQPPTLATVETATAVWTNANDIDPIAPATKPVYSVVAQEPTQVYIAAIPTRLGFGNFMGQFDPETVSAFTDLAIANAARVAELNLWTLIQGFSTNTITSSKVLGASRDLFTTIIQAASAYRFSNRLNRDQILTALFPVWGMDMIKQDRVMELAHDGQSIDVFSIPDSWVNDALMAHGIKVIWSIDGLAANAGGGTYVNQNFAAFAPSSGIPAYPSEVVWNLFVEGSVQFLDGGRLDLGVVRDSTLDATNDYETFVEPFETVANRSFAGGVLQIVSTTHPTGSTSGGITVS